jgi:hypothetical protein
MTIESHATAYPLIYPPRCRRCPKKKLAKKKLAQEKTCHVGQITCICTPSQEMSSRRETGRGLFDSDGDPHSRAHSPSQPAHCRKTRPRGRRPNQLPCARVRAALFVSSNNNERSRRGQHDGYPDIAFLGGPGRDHGMRGVGVSAEIIAFVPRLNRKRGPRYFPPATLRSAPCPDDLTMDHADTAPCEYLPSFDLPGPDLKNG